MSSADNQNSSFVLYDIQEVTTYENRDTLFMNVIWYIGAPNIPRYDGLVNTDISSPFLSSFLRSTGVREGVLLELVNEIKTFMICHVCFCVQATDLFTLFGCQIKKYHILCTKFVLPGI